MPVDAFRLENFMAFEDTGWIELRKINLLLGRNSSGKSAIIRALRLMKQSWLNEENAGQSLTFRIEGGVDVGSFDSVRHREPEKNQQADAGDHQPTQQEVEDEQWRREQFTFSYRGHLSEAEFEEIMWPIFFARAKKGALPEDFVVWKREAWPELQALLRQFAVSEQEQPIFHVSASYRKHKATGKSYVWKYALGVCQSLVEDDPAPICGYNVETEKWDSFDIYEYVKLAPDAPVSLKDIFKPDSYTHFLPELNLYDELPDTEQRQPLEWIENFGQVCREIVAQWLDSIVHIGPIRPEPQRTYIVTDEVMQKWRTRGWQSFLDYMMRQDSRVNGKVNHWLDIFKLGKSLSSTPHHTKRIGDFYGVYTLQLDESGGGDIRNLADVGFGASQIIPVVVQCFAAKRDALILVEQPELHLHPGAQAHVADMCIECSNEPISKKGELNPRQRKGTPTEQDETEPANRRFLIETHSETLFLRLRVRLAETSQEKAPKYQIAPEDFRCYFIERPRETSASGGNAAEQKVGVSRKTEIRFDEFGSYEVSDEVLDEFVEFFGDDDKELDDLLEARRQQKKEEK
jgi:hypothetical protein